MHRKQPERRNKEANRSFYEMILRLELHATKFRNLRNSLDTKQPTRDTSEKETFGDLLGYHTTLILIKRLEINSNNVFSVIYSALLNTQTSNI